MILRLACADGATAGQLCRVCRGWEALCWTLTRQGHTTVDLSNDSRNLLCALPYLPQLDTISCTEPLQRARAEFMDGILSVQLAAWPQLTSLSFRWVTHPLEFPASLHLAPNLSTLSLDATSSRTNDQPSVALGQVWQLASLRSLTLQCRAPKLAWGNHGLKHLSALQHLTSLTYRNHHRGASSLSRGVASALPALPALRRLELGGWCSGQQWESDREVWEVLMTGLCTLAQLTQLTINDWKLHHANSAAYFPSLARTLEGLHMLSLLCLQGRTMGLPRADETAVAAGRALVRRIGSLPQLKTLVLSCLGAVDVLDACQCIAPLTGLHILRLHSLPATATATDANPQAALAAEGKFAHLLTHLTQLQNLELSAMDFRGPAAARVFGATVLTLVHLKELDLADNGIGLPLLKVLAQSTCQLPRLREIHVGQGNHCVPLPGVLADLNALVGRFVFLY